MRAALIASLVGATLAFAVAALAFAWELSQTREALDNAELVIRMDDEILLGLGVIEITNDGIAPAPRERWCRGIQGRGL